MDAINRQIDMLWEADDEPPSSLAFDGFFNDLLNLLDLGDVELAVLITTDQRMAELNRTYRQKDRTTDVLSFPNDSPPPPGEARHLGDIVISLDEARRNAGHIGQTLDQELRFLGLHGLLHLLGYDHETDDGEMLALQSELKDKLVSYF